MDFSRALVACGVAGVALALCGCSQNSGGGEGEANAHLPPPATVSSVEPQQLLGMWYENASITPEGKVHPAAVLSIDRNSDKSLALSYRWHQGSVDGPVREVHTVAMPTDPPADVKFHLKSASSPLPDNLWVLATAADSSIVVLGSPDHETLFILSRQPTIFANPFGELVHYLQTQGYPMDKLRLAVQTPTAQ
ncbi:MAG TPA: lipocalin family protein [Phycisphaerae bacterium]|nr:lipocalin family protein [Phycisphaerae bacterium]